MDAIRSGRVEDHAAHLLRHRAYASLEIVRDEAATTLLIKLRIRALTLLGSTLDPSVGDPLLKLWSGWLERDYLGLTVHEEARQYRLLVAEEQRWLEPVLRSLRTGGESRRLIRSVKHTPVRALVEFLQILAEPDGYAEADAESLITLPVFFDRWEEQLFKTTLLHFDELEHCRPTVRA